MRYFGTDGIRGNTDDFLTYDLAFAVGKSLQTIDKTQVIIGRDTRESGESLAEAITQGAKISGKDVFDANIIPTPLLAYLSKINGCIGIMITASHNPYRDNGIKIFVDGKKLLLREEQKIEDYIDENMSFPKPDKVGKEILYEHPLASYKDLFTPFLKKTSLKIALDLANGATVSTAPHIFQRIAGELILTANAPNGKNINKNVGSTHLSHLIETVNASKADLGFAFDGDGDRVLAVGKDGTVYSGDHLIYILACHLKEEGHLNNMTVALTKMSNLGIEKALNAQGIHVVRTDVGDKNVLAELNRGDYSLGGENSGHIIIKDLLPTGDGVLAAAMITMIMASKNQSLKSLTEDVSMYAEHLKNIANVDKGVLNDVDVKRMIRSVERELGDDGFVVVRPSGTEPVIRVFACAKTMDMVKTSVAKIEDIIEQKQLEQGDKA